jgi:hypothetical protein
MGRVRRITYEDGRGNEAWYEGDATAWVDEGYAIAFHGRETIRIPKNRILIDEEYNKTSFCFISTAVFSNIGFDDDCSDLKILRYYRDNYLLNTINGRRMVEDYYSIAPIIVNQIDRLPNKNQIYSDIYSQYLKKIILLINQNEFDSASQKYKTMVDDLLIKYNT